LILGTFHEDVKSTNLAKHEQEVRSTGNRIPNYAASSCLVTRDS